ncbi:hypothetical protein DEO72_LG1g2447 [Vigna unguiculata]|uniref:Uncharacterized protein n=1 Tax=Vigna unguiculata TaxID=3917 RepID=A0A4D6KWG6_VIGUN|nr:hypothetical protein DEO72_LG1g2447 [Vigna unguiculata]
MRLLLVVAFSPIWWLTFSYLCRFVHGAVADLWCCWFAYNGIGLRLAVMVDSRRDGSDGGLLLDELSRDAHPWLTMILINGVEDGDTMEACNSGAVGSTLTAQCEANGGFNG